MGVVKLSTAGILDYSKTSNFLSGNAPVSFGAFDLLETVTITSPTTGVTFSGLGAYSDYKHLQIRAVTQDTSGSSDLTNNVMRFNGDSGSNYSRHTLYGNGTSVISASQTNATFITLLNTLARTGSVFSALVIDILDFSNVQKNTTVRTLAGGNATSESVVSLHSGAWYNTSAVTSIEFPLLTYAAGTRFSLYGVK